MKNKFQPHKIINNLYGNVSKDIYLYVSKCKNMDELNKKISELELEQNNKKKGLLQNNVNINIWGKNGVDFSISTYEQMVKACKIPVAIKGALMPDAHEGYALPIGGVIALDNSISPYMVGVDIGCRMHCTIFDITEKDINWDKFEKHLTDSTYFGAGIDGNNAVHDILDDDNWNILNKSIQGIKDLAKKQLGSSGGGNHFANLGILDSNLFSNKKYLVLFTHSGSRKVGMEIANYYSKIAFQYTKKFYKDIPKNYEWLSLSNEDGQDYYKAMTLALEFSKANHEVIHKRFIENTGLSSIMTIGNNHNFAQIINIDGQQLVLHRKGATPAVYGDLGIIPGTMGTNTYIVKGKGNKDSLYSASHGAGRLFSRTEAKNRYNANEMKSFLHKVGIKVIGFSPDEAPHAYKDIEKVMELQKDLVEIVGVIKPKIVRMSG